MMLDIRVSNVTQLKFKHFLKRMEKILANESQIKEVLSASKAHTDFVSYNHVPKERLQLETLLKTSKSGETQRCVFCKFLF